jgi:hypothetical protein
MKTTLILSTLIFMAVLIGCSNNTNLTGPDNQNKGTGTEPTNFIHDNELIWHTDNLSLNTINGTPYVNRDHFSIDQPNLSRSYLITFEGYTNADMLINDFSPLVEISKDNQVLLSLYDKKSINKHIEFQLNNVIANDIQFVIALVQVIGNKGGRTSVLNLTDLRIYLIK